MNDPLPEGHMASYIARRKFLATLAGAAAAWPLAARAQQPAKLPTIGLVGGAIPSTQGAWITAFVQRLRELGWIENRAVAIEVRWAEGRNERYSEIAAEFVRLKVDVIVTQGTPATIAAKQVTSVIPSLRWSRRPGRYRLGRKSGATRGQRHRPVESASRCFREAPRTLARARARSAPVGVSG